MSKGQRPTRTWDPAELARSGSLTTAAAHYLRYLVMLNYAQATQKTVKSSLLHSFVWMSERDVCDIADVTRPILERYQRHLFQYRKKDGSPLAVSTQRDRIKIIKGFFSWAVKKHIIPANPAADLEYPRPIRTIPHTLTLTEVRAVLAQPDIGTPVGLCDRALLELLYATGLRRLEACNLRVDDIEWQRGIVRVNQGKGNKDRLVPLGNTAKGWMSLYVEKARDCLLADASERHLIITKSGKACTTCIMGNTVRKYLTAAGITKSGCCHLFRHSMATHLLDNGADVRYIQEMLGHANLETTAKYTQVSIERLRAIHSACHPSERPQAAAEDDDSTDTPQAADAAPEAATE